MGPFISRAMETPGINSHDSFWPPKPLLGDALRVQPQHPPPGEESAPRDRRSGSGPKNPLALGNHGAEAIGCRGSTKLFRVSAGCEMEFATTVSSKFMLWFGGVHHQEWSSPDPECESWFKGHALSRQIFFFRLSKTSVTRTGTVSEARHTSFFAGFG